MSLSEDVPPSAGAEINASVHGGPQSNWGDVQNYERSLTPQAYQCRGQMRERATRMPGRDYQIPFEKAHGLRLAVKVWTIEDTD